LLSWGPLVIVAPLAGAADQAINLLLSEVFAHSVAGRQRPNP